MAAITWRNVDVPAGLNQASAASQQSYGNVTDAIRKGVDTQVCGVLIKCQH